MCGLCGAACSTCTVILSHRAPCSRKANAVAHHARLCHGPSLAFRCGILMISGLVFGYLQQVRLYSMRVLESSCSEMPMVVQGSIMATRTSAVGQK